MTDSISKLDHDASLIAIITAPLGAGETAALGFARKERELCAAVAALPVLAARALHARLLAPRDGDALAAAFMRFTAERRERLLAFLADARRREALARWPPTTAGTSRMTS